MDQRALSFEPAPRPQQEARRNPYSIVLFYSHRYETVVETIPTCLNPGESHASPWAPAIKVIIAYRTDR
jgi:hypothetical protein